MTKARYLFFPFAVAFLLIISASGAKAQTAIVTENNNCLIPDSNGVIRVFGCTNGGDRYTITNGMIRTADNKCFDHGIPRGTNPSGNNGRYVKLVPCREGNQSQVWYIIADGANVGLIQNAVNPDVCLNIEGGNGNDRSGGSIVVWGCGFGHPVSNEKFYIGSRMSSNDIAQLTTSIIPTFNSRRMVTFDNGDRIVAQGGGNIVAQGGGNIVAQGGGNIIAAGPASIVAQGGGNIVAQGGGNRHVQSVGSTPASVIVSSSRGHSFH